ncbi:MAG: hypothetical protein JXA90_14800, partial [Planctomycetes bacterium]|nr:hypothetical protein [Planctomycetota bacterium]
MSTTSCAATWASEPAAGGGGRLERADGLLRRRLGGWIAGGGRAARQNLSVHSRRAYLSAIRSS